MYILALDPGGTTGWCGYDTEKEEFHNGIVGPAPHHYELWGMISSMCPDILIYESFQVSVKTTNAVSLEYIGIFKLYAYSVNIKLVPQTSSAGLGFWDDGKLSRVGQWHRVIHVRDATRHLLHYMTFTRKDPQWIRMLEGPTPGEFNK